MASPLEQFAIQDLTAPLFSIGGHHIAVTNSAVFMMGAVVLSSGLLLAGAGKGAMIPGRIQAMSELFIHRERVFLQTQVSIRDSEHARQCSL